MKDYKRALKRRLLMLVAFNVLMVIFILFTRIYSPRNAGNVQNFIQGFQTGIFLALQLPLLFNMIKYTNAIKDEQSLKKLYIQEKDERTKLIRDKIGGGRLFLLFVCDRSRHCCCRLCE